MMPPLGRYSRAAATAMSQTRLRSATDMEKIRPACRRRRVPPPPKSTNQWRKFFRKTGFIERQGLRERVGTAAQIPFRRSRARVL